MRLIFLFCFSALVFGCKATEYTPPSNPLTFQSDDSLMVSGFFDFEWNSEKGSIHLYVDKLDEEFLYVNSLSAGVGSNDIGLDRGQLGRDRIVKFTRAGNKLLLTHVNYDYRAVSDNVLERQAVEQAFAQSVLFGFKIVEEADGKIKIDLTPFLMQDAHGVTRRLAQSKQGNYRLDPSRSAVYLPRTKSFPENTEFEMTMTFTGDPKGAWIRSVVPSPEAVTVRQHHSFIKLPDNEYQPRQFDPRSGFNALQFADYATPIEKSLIKRVIVRHRLRKKNPAAARSEAVEPIVYHLDPGCPEPIRSALIEGASWWNQAFEAAGYINAFQVKMLPVGADPMDVRYNLIQWVHRSTRGWSYGASVVDPRTGEIIKGHVSLGSLRVRQDFLIAQGLAAPYQNDSEDVKPLLDLALARLRQLSAHEVGHTIGLAHNFASSKNDRASVMDYPHPLVQFAGESISFDNAYATGIGAWDKRTVLYGYQDFPNNINEENGLREILRENESRGLFYISDRDARPQGGAHPYAHLWDNGENPVDELERVLSIRKKAISRFGLNNIPDGAPLATLENVFAPLYLGHRYQVEAAVKIIGGVNYSYSVKGDQQDVVSPVQKETQQAAFEMLLKTLSPEVLMIPDHILKLIPPQPLGYSRSRELFKLYTGLTFDPLAAAESAAHHTLHLMMNPQRLARIMEQRIFHQEHMALSDYFLQISKALKVNNSHGSYEEAIYQMSEKIFIQELFKTITHQNANLQVKAEAMQALHNLLNAISGSGDTAHQIWIVNETGRFLKDPANYPIQQAKELPDGSPIGCSGM